MKSFTLIELLVSMAILMIFAAVFLVNRNSPEGYELINAAERLAADIQQVQGFAMSAKGVGGSIPDGWGVHIDKTQNCYIIFADSDSVGSAKTYDPGAGEVMCDADSNPSPSERLERVFFPRSVEISDVLKAGVSTNDPLDIVFVPPHPDTYVNTAVQEGRVVLTGKTFSSVKTVIVNTVGNVRVQ